MYQHVRTNSNNHHIKDFIRIQKKADFLFKTKQQQQQPQKKRPSFLMGGGGGVETNSSTVVAPSV